jgi:hypothetical protein
MTRLPWILFFLLLLCFVIHPIVDGDIFFYLSYARKFLELGGHFPGQDPFLYTIKNWHVTHEWLAYLYYFAGVSFFGISGVPIFSFFIWCLSFLGLLIQSVRLKIENIVSLPIVILVLLSCCQRFIDRAGLFSDAFVSLMIIDLLILFDKRKHLPNNRLFCYPIVFLLWVNLHPGFIIGLAIYTLFIISHAEDRKAWRSWVSCFSSYMASLINPQFINGALYPFKSVLDPGWNVFRKINFEWMPTFISPMVNTWEVQVFIFLCTITFILLGLAVRKVGWKRSIFPVLIFLILFYLVQDAVRFVSTASLGMAGLCLWSLDKFDWPKFQKKRLLLNSTISLILLMSVLFVFFFGYKPSSGFRKFGTGVTEENFPIGALEFFQKNKLSGRIFNQYEWGGYLIWSLNLDDNLFIHTHVDESQFLLIDYYGMSRSRELFESSVNKYNIKYFLLNNKIYQIYPKPGLLQILEDGVHWQLIYRDNVAVLFKKVEL